MPSITDRVKITPKTGFLFLGMILAAAYYATVDSPNSPNATQIASLNAEIIKAESKLKETEDRTRDKAHFQDEVERVSETFRLALEYLPKELDVQDLLKKVYSESRAAGTELSTFKPKDPVPKDFYEELNMEIGVRGNYPQIITFLGNISKIPRIINVRNVEITHPILVDGYPTLTLTGTLVAYRYKEKTK